MPRVNTCLQAEACTVHMLHSRASYCVASKGRRVEAGYPVRVTLVLRWDRSGGHSPDMRPCGSARLPTPPEHA